MRRSGLERTGLVAWVFVLCTAAVAADRPERLSPEWWHEALANIRLAEYDVSFQPRPTLPGRPGGLHVANRAQDLRAYFLPDGVEVTRRTATLHEWRLRLALVEAGTATRAVSVRPVEPRARGAVVDYDRGGLSESWENTPQGLRLHLEMPASSRGGPAEAVFELSGDLEATLAPEGGEVVFHFAGRPVVRLERAADPAGDDRPRLELADGLLRARFGAGRRGSDRLSPLRRRLTLDLLLSGPATIAAPRRLSTTPDWFFEANRLAAFLGASATTAGDVNGDGFGDVIVGAPNFDNGETAEGRAFLFEGGPTGPSPAPAWTVEADQSQAFLGASVAAAGDVDGDGFDDVIVGADNFSNGQTGEGRALLYRGSPDGLSSSPSWTAESDQDLARFGGSVASAGDVNGDGFADVIVGAAFFDGAFADEGRVFVYLGSPSGPSTLPIWFADGGQANARLGTSVATAGDVDGDGFGDVIAGAPGWDNPEFDEGRALIYRGSADGLTAEPLWTAEADQPNALFGEAVGTAGDVDGDGYADVVVGASLFAGQGRAFAYYGDVAGPAADWDWIAEAGQSGARFGRSVATAGDVNGDGFADVIVGASDFDNDEVDEGRAFVYLGSHVGLLDEPVWVVEGGQDGAALGTSVSAAGDINGDGFGDVIVGAPLFDNGQPAEGRAFAYLGGPDGPATEAASTFEGNQPFAGFGGAVASAGDVNGDGFSDVIVGAPLLQGNAGSAFVFHGSGDGLSTAPDWTAEGAQPDAQFGSSVASAGDVDGDGYGDVIVGAIGYSGGEIGEGRALVFRGSSTGLSEMPDWTVESDVPGAALGTSVAAAGDVNGDGYGDVIVGAPALADGGAAVVYHGSPSGPSLAADWSAFSDLPDAGFGGSVGSARDVNGDGFSDVIVGASAYGEGFLEVGRALVYLGSRSGLSDGAAWIVDGEQDRSQFGVSVGTAGDVNGDGFSDVIVGASAFSTEDLDLGRAFVYSGSSAGLSISPTWIVDGDQASAGFGAAAAAAGDVNGDGFGDVIVGSPLFENGELREGRASIYLGSPAGLSAAADWVVESDLSDGRLGVAVATAGDVNGDGFSDVIVGANFSTNVEFFEGSARVYLGNGGGGPSRPVGQTLVGAEIPIGPLGQSNFEEAFGLSVVARTAAGRGRVRAEWEVKPVGAAFDGSEIRRSAEAVDTGAPFEERSQVGLEALVDGLEPAQFYHWRTRVTSDSPFFPRSPWRSIPTNDINETKLRTAGELPETTFALVGPGTNELIFPDSDPLIFSWSRGASSGFRLEWSHNPEFETLVETSPEIQAATGGEIQVYAPDDELWTRVRKLAKSPEIRRVPIFWRVVPAGQPAEAGEVRVIRMETAQRPELVFPTDGTELLPSQPPLLVWEANHNERYRVVFSAKASLAPPVVDSASDFALNESSWQVPEATWSDIVDLSVHQPDGVVYFAIFARDSIDRLTWSAVSSLRVLPGP